MADKFIFDSLPGAGPKMAPRLLVAFGENRERYETCEEIEKYAGGVPVLERSGKQEWIHWRRSCPIFLRQTFIEIRKTSGDLLCLFSQRTYLIHNVHARLA